MYNEPGRLWEVGKGQEGDSLQLMGCHSGEEVEEHGVGGFIEWVSFCRIE